MNIKKYIAATLQEAVDAMKQELGDDAIIITTRVIDTNDPYQPKKFEVVAAIDSDPINQPNSKKEKIKVDQPEDIDGELVNLRNRIRSTYHKDDSSLQAPKPPKARLDTEKVTTQHASNEHQKTSFVKKPLISIASQPIEDRLGEIKTALMEAELGSSLTNKIIEQIKTQAGFIPSGSLDPYVLSALANLIPTSPFLIEKKKGPYTVALVGPTGVGKTTCIAKLSLISKALHKLDVGIITIDTYRLGAVEQLKIFSNVSKIEYLVANEVGEMSGLLKKFSKKDLVFIDTAGRSQNNTKQLEEIKQFLSQIQINEILLALNSGVSTKTMLDIAKKFAAVNYTGFIFTKLDESAAYGSIVNTAVKMGKPIKFFTNGQTIPDDIIAADAEYLARLIYSPEE